MIFPFIEIKIELFIGEKYFRVKIYIFTIGK